MIFLKKIRSVLGVSILLNILLLGVIGGMTAHRFYHKPWKHAYAEVSPEAQHIMARHFQKMHRDMKPKFQEARQARRALNKALQADPFDREAFEEAVERVHKSHAMIMREKTQMVADLAEELSPKDREKLSGRILRPFGKRPHDIHRGKE